MAQRNAAREGTMSGVVLDHVAIAARDLAEVAAVEAVLDVPLEPGGRHAAMATHNRLLSLGPGEYLEVIAIDPDAEAPGRPRWFDLDRFDGPPAPRAWILRCDDLGGALARAPGGIGEPMLFTRDDLRWEMAVPDDGVLPFGGVFPALIGWGATPHPSGRLVDHGVRLAGLEVIHPEPEALEAALGALLWDSRARVVGGAEPGLRFRFRTPSGERVLG